MPKKIAGPKITKNLVTSLELHEQICAIRYENLEKRLESGGKRFARLEYLIWGLYAVLISTNVIAKVL
jgi:hypothetical protein